MGCMRLSTERDRDEPRAIAIIHAALDAGVRFLDTADAYCLDDSETGHNERLIARALTTWSGDASRVIVATKGGLTRPNGAWAPDGRARHLSTACEASLRALGVDRVHLYQLHAVDPRTPLATSVRALASLKQSGLVDTIGLCNVTVGQIEEARRIAEIAAVQVELSAWNDSGILSGVADYCAANGIRLIAYRPLGGPRRVSRAKSDPALAAVGARHGATPCEVALAWLMDLSPLVVPIPGPTRIETAQSLGRASRIVFGDDRAELDERFPTGRTLRCRNSRAAGGTTATTVDGEIVLVMGLPAAGKSTVARELAAQGYTRLNRDEAGGSLRGLLPSLDRAIAGGRSRIVLDNTYGSRKSRAAVIDAAARHGLSVRCLHLATSLDDAQVNAAWRMQSNTGPEIAPTVQFRYHRDLEPPDPSEGFSRIDVVTFARRPDESFVNRALIVWCDGVLMRSRSGERTPSTPDDVELIPGRRAILRRYEADGFRLLGMSWQPEIAGERRSAGDAERTFARMQELLEVSLEVEYCPHAAGPPTCWCRKPLPGLGVLFIRRHRLDASRCIYVGSGPQDPGFARRLGFQYRDAEVFFSA
jgi:aryl-alcohol dehydrogenase-like predicted oxidoreductase/histidinol phosphatase-like enzyme